VSFNAIVATRSRFIILAATMPHDLRELVKRLRASDHSAFKIVFDTWQDAIFKFLYYRTNDTQAAEDLLQDVFLKFWNARESLNENQSIKNYLYTIADNLVLNQWRHLKVVARHEREHEMKEVSVTENPQFVLEEQEWRVKLQQAIDALPEKPRVVFLMSRMEDLSYQEIAERLSLSIKTVESHMVKALKLLRQSVKKDL
jgi:RNA polymerase sigma-70 factor (ECF subfamily)